MSVSGLTGSPLRYCFRLPDHNQGMVCRQVSAIPIAGKPKEIFDNLHIERSKWTVSARRWKTQKTHLIKCAMDASYGDMAGESGEHGGDAELANSYWNAYPSNTRNTQLYELNENYLENHDANSVRRSKDEEDTNSLGSWKYEANGSPEPIGEASTSSGVSSRSPLVRTRDNHRSWADMAQEDEFKELEEEEDQQHSESRTRVVSLTTSIGELGRSKVVEKPKLSRDQREYIRFMNVKRKKDFVCLERVKGKMVNILEGKIFLSDQFWL